MARTYTSPLKRPTAIVYCEGNFGELDGKTANGLIRSSELYKILAVIDSTKAGQDAGMVLGGKPNHIPICSDLVTAFDKIGKKPTHLIFGMAPSSGMLSDQERVLILAAIQQKMSIVNGLHEFLNDDSEFFNASVKMKVELIDMRKPRPIKELRTFTGRVLNIDCPRIAILGTDCAIGKRTTATILTKSLRDLGLNVIMISTGQTGLIQGSRYGIALDAVPSQFCAGELEATILEAYENENPQAIIIEGQGALSHPAFSTSAFILRGSCPQAVIMQHAPGRRFRCDFDSMEMPTPSSEIKLIETFSNTKVIGLSINHERLTEDELENYIEKYEAELGIPVTDVLVHSPKKLLEILLSKFASLKDLLSQAES